VFKKFCIVLLIVFLIMFALPSVMAQDTTPEPTPTAEAEATQVVEAPDVTVVVEQPNPEVYPSFDLEAIFVSVGLFLGVVLAMAGSAQAFIAKVKEPIILKWGSSLDAAGIAIALNVAQFIAAVILVFALPGLAAGVATLAPIMAIVRIPDLLVGVIMVGLVMAGEDIIYAAIASNWAIIDGLKELKNPPAPLPNNRAARGESVTGGD
jgi:hypothetical protein